ncbi:hypothetical protein PN836_005325 [Ningiella sp. W23]|uniref:hypothetical protein n=1 Tax=Ningiella sp. W23 TaxID=3023715 RepID=UPI0037572F04
MMRTLFLHVGPTKTGTSAIQAYFKDRSFASLHYPKIGRWADGSHHKLMFASHGRKQHGATEIPDWPLIKEELIEEIAATEKNVLLSSEVCQPNFVAQIQDIIETFHFKLIVLLVYRSAQERAASVYNQSVKDPLVGMHLEPAEFLRQNSEQLKIRPLYERWYAVSQNIRLLPYFDERPLIDRFCDTVCVEYEPSAVNTIYNRSMGGHALLAMLLANQILTSDSERSAFFEAMRQLTDFHIWSGNSYPFDASEVQEISTQYHDDHMWAMSVIHKVSSKANKTTHHERFTLSPVQCEKIRDLFIKQGLYSANQGLIDSSIARFAS